MPRLPLWLQNKRIISIDFETFGTAGYYWDGTRWRSIRKSPPHGLGAVGSAVYAAHPNTDVLCLGYMALDDMVPHLWINRQSPPPRDLFDHIHRGGLVAAWNSLFEFFVWNYHCVPRLGWPPLPVEQMIDTMSMSYSHSYPGALKNAAKVLGGEQKWSEGGRLLDKFSKPRKPTKGKKQLRILPSDDPIDGAKLYLYCLQDVATEIDIAARLPHLSDFERQVWLIDQRINIRGVQIDVEFLDRLISFIRELRAEYRQELVEITDGAADTGRKVDKLLQWLRQRMPNVSLPNLDAEIVESTLDDPLLPPDCRRVLELRQLLSMSSVDKLFAFKNQLGADNRIRGLFVYQGADRTGRWAGRGAQPHNPPRAKFYPEIREMRTAAELKTAFKNPFEAISGCIRPMYCAKPGHDLICSDYSAIEAVVLAELARESWRQEVFRTHRKIYEMSAAKITGVPFEEFLDYKKRTGEHHPYRSSIGKVAELASGFGGWIGAWKRFGADKYFDSDSKIKDAILKWRRESPAIVEFWGGQYRKTPGVWHFTQEYYGIEGAAVKAVLSPGNTYSYNGIHFCVDSNTLYCMLPSGRNLIYHEPRLDPGAHRLCGLPEYKLSFMGWNDNPQMGPVGWVRIKTYGGKLTENIDQATSRDLLAATLVRVEAAGYLIVMHIHDEIVCEVPEGSGSIDELERLMSIKPDWAADWPIIAAGGWRGKYFRKE